MTPPAPGLREVSAFDVFSRMCDTGDKALKLAPLGNVTNLKKVKAGTQVTIGVEGDVVGSIFWGKFVGGLILCDKQRFDAVKADLKSELKKLEEAALTACLPPQDAYELSVRKLIARLNDDQFVTLNVGALRKHFAVQPVAAPACPHERLNEEGYCRACGEDRRGI